MDEAQVIHMLSDVWKQAAYPHARLAMLLPGKRAGEQFILAAMKDVGVLGGIQRLAERFGHRLAFQLLQRRLVIKSIYLRWPADHVKEDDRLGLSCKVGSSRQIRIQRIDRLLGWVGTSDFPLQQGRKSQCPKSRTTTGQERTTRTA